MTATTQRQAARSIHFLGMAFLTIFMVMHVALVFIVHRDHNVTHMVFGSYDPARVAQATTIMVLVAVLVVAAWIAISYLSLVDVRAPSGSCSACWSRSGPSLSTR